LRGRDNDFPTDDPVELERELLRSQGLGSSSQSAEPASTQGQDGRWSLLSKLALILSLGLVIGYLFIWVKAVQDVGGPEGYIKGSSTPGSERGPVDFVSTLTGATIIRDGNGRLLYDQNTQHDAQDFVLTSRQPTKLLPYNHLPFEALLIAPMLDIPYPLIFAFWTMAAGLAIGVSLGMLDGAQPVSRPVGWVMSMAACSYLPLIRSLMLGQNTPLVLLGLCSTYVTLKRGQHFWAGASLLLVALKPQVLPVVLLLMLLQGHWKALVTFAALMLALSVAAMPTLGVAWPLDYVKLLVGVAGWTDVGAIDPAIMHNWRGFFTNLFSGQLAGLVTPFFMLASLLSVGLLVRAWLSSRQALENVKVPTHTQAWDLLWALAGIVAVLTSLHLNPHDLALLIFPAWIIGAYAMSGEWRRPLTTAWLIILWTGYLLPPLTLYQSNNALAVLPSVLVMVAAVGLLVWQLTTSRFASWSTASASP
jgi:hypothetical protein